MVLFKSSVSVNGVMSQKVKLNEMGGGNEPRPFNSETLYCIGDIIFKVPLPVRVSYEDRDGHWCLENEELSLSGYGKTYHEAWVSFSDSCIPLLLAILHLRIDHSRKSPER